MDTDQILDHMSEGALVVTATRRLSRLLLQQYDLRQKRRGTGAWPTPAAISWDDWIESEWRRLAGFDPVLGQSMLLDDEQELLLWENVVAQAGAGDGTGELLQVAAAARSARDARRLLDEWCISPADIGATVHEDTRAFLRWLSDVDRIAERHGWLFASALPRIMGKLLEDKAWLPDDFHVFVGFDLWVPAQKRLLAQMSTAGIGLKRVSTPRINQSKRVVSCADRRQEFEAAAIWARALVARVAPDLVGIVVDDLGEHRDQVEAIFDRVLGARACIGQDDEWHKAFHISLGKPLADYPAVSTALVLLDFMVGVRPLQDATRLLLSPFISGGLGEYGDRARVDHELRRQRRSEVQLEDIGGCAKSGAVQAPVLQRLLARCAEYSAPARTMPSGWAAAFSDWLALFGWPGERSLSSLEHQTVEAWRELLGQFSRLNEVSQTIDAASAVDRVRRMAGRRIFQGRAAPVPVQILGVAESAGMQFDHLWICGMTDESWPPALEPSPFIPMALQRRSGMPGAGAALDLERYETLTTRLLDSARCAVVSYARTNADKPQQLSGLYPDLDEAAWEADVPGLFEAIARESPRLEAVADCAGPGLSGQGAQGGAEILKDQSACPFRSFARHRLGASDPPRRDPGLDAAERGNLTHDCLARLWRGLGTGDRLASLPPETLRRRIDRCVGAAIGAFKRGGRTPFLDRLLELERTRLNTLLAAWLEIERRRGAFEVVMIEHRLNARFCGLDLVLRIDRIDELQGRSRVIIDYKTGRGASVGHWRGDRPVEPQMPLYLLTLDEAGHDVSGLAFALLRTEGARFRGLSKGVPFAPGIAMSDDWASTQQRWREALGALADQYRTGAAAVDPRDSKVCDACALGPFCRVLDPASARAGASTRD